MKKIFRATVLATIVFVLGVHNTLLSQPPCTHTWNGTEQNLNVDAGQVYCFIAGQHFTGHINNQGVLLGKSGSVLSPQNNNNVQKGAVWLMTGSTGHFNNAQSGSFTVDQGASLTTTNDLNADTLINKGVTRVLKNFNPSNNAYVLNNNKLIVSGTANLNSNTTLTNNCTMFVGGSEMKNGGNLINNGLLHVVDFFYNNGSLVVGSAFGTNSTIRSRDFHNNGSTTGIGGKLYTTRDTRQQGTFAGTTLNAPLIVWDETNTSGDIFDYPSSNQNYTKTIRTYFVPGDTSTYSSNCGTNIILHNGPNLSVLHQRNGVVTLSYKDIVVSSIIERSYDGAVFHQIQTISDQEGVIKDIPSINKSIVYYRLKSGTSYTKTVSCALTKRNSALSIYQNGRVVQISCPEASSFLVTSIDGRTIGTYRKNATRIVLPDQPGMYIVTAVFRDGTSQIKKVIL